VAELVASREEPLALGLGDGVLHVGEWGFRSNCTHLDSRVS
jgi:hypothetical protein